MLGIIAGCLIIVATCIRYVLCSRSAWWREKLTGGNVIKSQKVLNARTGPFALQPVSH